MTWRGGAAGRRLALLSVVVAVVGGSAGTPSAMAQTAPAAAEPAPAPTAPVPAPTTSGANASADERRPDGTPDPATEGRCLDPAAFAGARRWARSRPGAVAFAVSERGEVQSFNSGVTFRSASLVKAMLLVADLRRHDRLGAGLSRSARSRLASMIRTSSNTAASATFGLVGADGLRALARAAGMRNYSVQGYWSSSRVAATDQARFFARLHELLPGRHAAFGRRLLRTIVSSQTWGGARIARSHGFETLFKSGWSPQPGGWVVHQGLRLERGGCTVGVAVLTSRQPNMSTGVATIRGVVARLL